MKHLLLASALGLAVVLSACTDGQAEHEPASTDAPATTTPSATSPSPKAAAQDKPAKRPTSKPKLSCEPAADAKFDDPDNPDVITNKDCPEINAAKGRAASEFANCEGSGGEWNLSTQRCTYPPKNEEPSPDGVEGFDPNYRDANGETYAEYCARIGYSGENVKDCPAG